MNRVLAIDPGITTGWAVVDHYGSIDSIDVVAHGTIPAVEGRVNVGNRIKRLFDKYNPDRVIIERIPAKLSQQLGDILGQIRRAILIPDEIIEISPGEWKPVAKLVKITPKQFPTQHEKDAYRMARYALFKLMKVPLN